MKIKIYSTIKSLIKNRDLKKNLATSSLVNNEESSICNPATKFYLESSFSSSSDSEDGNKSISLSNRIKLKLPYNLFKLVAIKEVIVDRSLVQLDIELEVDINLRLNRMFF